MKTLVTRCLSGYANFAHGCDSLPPNLVRRSSFDLDVAIHLRFNYHTLTMHFFFETKTAQRVYVCMCVFFFFGKLFVCVES